jgi:predicted RNase H-like HicB family nuclease
VVLPHPKKDLGQGLVKAIRRAAGIPPFRHAAIVRKLNPCATPAIEPGTDASAWGVVAPDLPGCFWAGDTMEEALIQAEDAVIAWIETAEDAGPDIPQPSPIDALRAAHPEFEAWLWGWVKIDPAMLDNALERVNISLPRRVPHRLDARARRAAESTLRCHGPLSGRAQARSCSALPGEFSPHRLPKNSASPLAGPIL